MSAPIRLPDPIPQVYWVAPARSSVDNVFVFLEVRAICGPHWDALSPRPIAKAVTEREQSDSLKQFGLPIRCEECTGMTLDH